MKKRLDQKFYAQDTQQVAQGLLGKILVRKIGHQTIEGTIIETEAYLGQYDKACHTSRGKTARNEIMFGPAGFWYVYMIYGMYHCLNIVTEKEDQGSAVLIRAVEPVSRLASNIKTDGPGKLCREFQIDRKLNDSSAFDNDSELYIVDNFIKPKINKTKRVGVDYAGKFWKNRLLRYHIEK